MGLNLGFQGLSRFISINRRKTSKWNGNVPSILNRVVETLQNV
jgi:hypothetical protein